MCFGVEMQRHNGKNNIARFNVPRYSLSSFQENRDYYSTNLDITSREQASYSLAMFKD